MAVEIISVYTLLPVPFDVSPCEGAMEPEEVAAELGLPNIMDRPWAIFKTSAIKNEGILEALEWISTAIP